MKKLFIRAAVALAILLGGAYVLTPNNASSNVKNTSNNAVASTSSQSTGQYVGLESKVSKSASTDDLNVPNGFSVKISPEAAQSGVLGNFEQAIKDKYIGDGNVEIYIAQGTGTQGGQEQVIYDVNINGKEYMNLTATRSVEREGFTTSVNESPIVFSQLNS